MLKVKIFSVGKRKEKWLEEGIREYEKRLESTVRFQFLYSKDDQQLISLVKRETLLIGLDQKGAVLSSQQFSHFLQNCFVQNGSKAGFVIGGPEGLPKELKDQLSLISLSSLTFTHQMTRLIFIEQVYRAMQLMQGSPYHK